MRKDSSNDKKSVLKGNLLLIDTSASIAAEPVLPASIGENHPAMRSPITSKKDTPYPLKLRGRMLILSFHADPRAGEEGGWMGRGYSLRRNGGFTWPIHEEF